MKIVASNDINEETIVSLNEQQHAIDSYGIGTHLVTCQKQPALGCVYKVYFTIDDHGFDFDLQLVAVSGQPKIKLSEDVSKITIPGRKRCYRLISRTGYSIVDLMMV